MPLGNRSHLTHHSTNFSGKEEGISQSNSEEVRSRCPQALKVLWRALLLSCNFAYQDICVIPWLILCLLLVYTLHEIGDQLLAWCLAYKVFNEYSLNGWKDGWNNEGRLLFVDWLESLVGSTILLFSTVLDDELLRGAEAKFVWWKSAAYLRFYKTDSKEPTFYSTHGWVSRLHAPSEWLILWLALKTRLLTRCLYLRIFRAVKLLHIILSWWIYVITHLYKHRMYNTKSEP